jgi:hypothetical protein
MILELSAMQQRCQAVLEVLWDHRSPRWPNASG